MLKIETDKKEVTNMTFKNAQEAFDHFYVGINKIGTVVGNGTKKLTNVGFFILNPEDNHILTDFRKWNPKYAVREFEWYLSQNRSVEELKKFAPIWDKMHGGDNIVNSNYGYQWNRNDQLEKVVEQLNKNKTTRQAWITIFDGKEKDDFEFDTPCTLNIGFEIDNMDRLCMTVLMRSNDLWYGFCNDQYCFSELQKLVAKDLDLKIGWYYHFASDLHLYDRHLALNK